mgnify:CR=1 FL=1
MIINTDRPYMYPLSFNEYTERLDNSFSKPNYQDASKAKQIKVALLWMRDGGEIMKYYNANKQHIFTGTDHGFME